MDTPSEWAKKFNQSGASEIADPAKQEAATVESPASTTAFPSEPFQCPACGQLLGPECRVCVSCKKPIDPAEIGRKPAVELTAAHPASVPVKRETVPYPWLTLLAVLGVGVVLSILSLLLLGEKNGPMAIQALPILAGSWVFFDAFRRRIPRPLRWSMGTMLLLAVILPWYLARRLRPEATVPFVEAETGRVTRILLLALIFFFLISVIVNILHGPQSASKPDATPKIQPTSSSPSRIT
jgi:hypothetical protein